MESKCPVCQRGSIVMKTGPLYPSCLAGCDSCCFQCCEEHFPRIAAAMAAERRLVELQEAVRWERECSMQNMAGAISQYTHHLYMTHGEDYLDEIQEEYEAIVDAARAAVDARAGEG